MKRLEFRAFIQEGDDAIDRGEYITRKRWSVGRGLTAPNRTPHEARCIWSHGRRERDLVCHRRPIMQTLDPAFARTSLRPDRCTRRRCFLAASPPGAPDDRSRRSQMACADNAVIFCSIGSHAPGIAGACASIMRARMAEQPNDPPHRPARRLVQPGASRPPRDQPRRDRRARARRSVVAGLARQSAEGQRARHGAASPSRSPRRGRWRATRRSGATEIEARLGTRYTVDTHRGSCAGAIPNHRFIWLMGADNLAQFHQWRDWRRYRARGSDCGDRASGL